MLRIADLFQGLEFQKKDLRKSAAKRLQLPESAVTEIKLVKKSLDARKKDALRFVCTVEAKVDTDESRLLARLKEPKVTIASPYRYELPTGKPLSQRPVVVGFGPGGMFAALVLAQCGQRPIVLERGESVEQREKTVEAFWQGGVLKTSTNVQFGEGGAGTFSDGKLTTGTGDMRIRKVLDELVAAGAPEEILFEAKPHIGTDRLPRTVQNIRRKIQELGGEVRFETQVVDFHLRKGKLWGISCQRTDGTSYELECSRLVLAVGHSARDTFERLETLGIPMEAKAFSVGARIEHPAALINEVQYGAFAEHPALGAADYKLSRQLSGGRGVYTFCMCPGGTVTGAASEEGGVVTNGMSTYRRNGVNSNAALLVGVTPADFGAEGPLAGMYFQRRIEQAAYRLAGSTYAAPAQRLEDFLRRRPSVAFGGVTATYRPGVVPAALDGCLPGFVTSAMREALPRMARQLKGFDLPDAVLTAPETRSSSPVRILRGEDGQSELAAGLFPCGEGAGYAGGIMSAAVDGIRCAEWLMAAAE